jgi:hypothetical protein
MLTDVKSLLCAYNDATNDGCHDQVREFNVSVARANLDDISPELATEVIRLATEIIRYRQSLEWIVEKCLEEEPFVYNEQMRKKFKRHIRQRALDCLTNEEPTL